MAIIPKEKEGNNKEQKSMELLTSSHADQETEQEQIICLRNEKGNITTDPSELKVEKVKLSPSTVENLDKMDKPASSKISGAFRDEDGGCGQEDAVW